MLFCFRMRRWRGFFLWVWEPFLPLTCWSGIYGGTRCRLGCGIYCHITTHILSHYDGPLPFPILSPLRCTFLFPLPLALPRAPYLRSFSATGAQSVWRCVPVRENESFASGRFPHLFRLSHLFFPCFFFFSAGGVSLQDCIFLLRLAFFRWVSFFFLHFDWSFAFLHPFFFFPLCDPSDIIKTKNCHVFGVLVLDCRQKSRRWCCFFFMNFHFFFFVFLVLDDGDATKLVGVFRRFYCFSVLFALESNVQ